MKKIVMSLAAALFCSALFAADYADYKSAMTAGKGFEKEKKSAEALEAYQAAAKIAAKPNEQIDALTKAARLLTSQKKNADAIALMTAFAENAQNPAAQRTMAYLECARAAAAPEEKLKYYDLGIAVKAGDWTEGACFNSKAEIFIKQKKNDEAEAIYKQVVVNEGYNEITRATGYTGLIRLATAKKDYAAAHGYCAKIRELGGKRYAFLLADAGELEANLFMSEQKWDDAVNAYKAIAASEKINKGTRVRAIESIIAVEFDKRNRPEEAKKALELFKTYNLPVSKKAQKYEKEIRELTE